VPTSDEQQDSLVRLNELIDSWGMHAQTLLVARRDVMALVICQQTYTIGQGANVNLPTPITIDAVSYIVLGSSPATEVFLEWATDQAYVGQAQKTHSGSRPAARPFTPTRRA